LVVRIIKKPGGERLCVEGRLSNPGNAANHSYSLGGPQNKGKTYTLSGLKRNPREPPTGRIAPQKE